ncbi:MAG: tRNA (guanosine(37)-N1)-methyltransferase TrmD [Lachnospiraceae bacterium]|jgi:tRNA (guanine37-N1)-methyltransferase
MNFHVLTLFPQMITDGFHTSITGRAMDAGLLSLETVDIRDFSNDKHFKVDDYTYGGGAGLLMKAEPVCAAYDDLVRRTGHKMKTIYLTPQGSVFNQEKAAQLAKETDLCLLCGHYEGIDERALEELGAEFISVGDYVLTGGELPALIVMDAVSRLVPGVLHNNESAETESFGDGLLEYPQYTRPEEFRGRRVPEILLSGDHGKVDAWRHEQSLRRTARYRPDLLAAYLAAHPDEKGPEEPDT